MRFLYTKLMRRAKGRTKKLRHKTNTHNNMRFIQICYLERRRRREREKKQLEQFTPVLEQDRESLCCFHIECLFESRF
jgi:hypothetical protein